MSNQVLAAENNIPLVAPLSLFGRADLAIAGGKGANLGELLRAGFDVPPGFIVTTAAYDLVLDGRPATPGADEMQQVIRAAPMPEVLRVQIVNAYRQLGSGAVAVRSSATAEDLPGAAFAGQQETFLNVQGEQALLEAVRECWASLWSERAVAYRARQSAEPDAARLAVVVQQMVDADAAGVLFTANPVSGARDELSIDANPGLGEAVVAGMVTPDHILVDKRSRRVKEQRVGRREIIVRSKAGGGTEQVKPDSQRSSAPPQAVLSNEAIRRLSELGVQIERHYGKPQDIEWAWMRDGAPAGKLLILQARPMTALPEPVKISGPMKLVVPMLAEIWPVRPYPLDMTSFTGVVLISIGNLIRTMLGSSAPDLTRLLTEQDGVITNFTPPVLHPNPSILIQPWRAIRKTRQYDPLHWKDDPILAEFLSKTHELEKRDLASLSWAQILQTIHEEQAVMLRGMELRERYLPKAAIGLGGLWLLLGLAGRTGRFSELISGIATKTAETNRALEALAQGIRAEPALQQLFAQHEARELADALSASAPGREFLGRFDAFLDQYGHRETTFTISQPAWKDEPDVVLGILKVLSGAESKIADHGSKWESARDELLRSSILGKWPLRSPFLRDLLLARALFQIREDTHFYATLVQPAIRHAALELSGRLTEAGALEQTSDIFHLRLEELEQLGEPRTLSDESRRQLRTLVSRRKARRDSLASKPMVDPRLLAVGRTAPTGADVLLQGTSGSPGTATGAARIVHNSSEFGNLQAGEVLVAPATNPAWTPLFQRAAAVVVDAGSAGSHAAIVAREYGIPAVMATITGTTELQDGQRIEVDGTRGLVLRAKESE